MFDIEVWKQLKQFIHQLQVYEYVKPAIQF